MRCSMLLGVLLSLEGIGAQLYEWNCSPLDDANNRYYLPNLDIGHSDTVLQDRNNLEPSASGIVYIFPVSSALNCSGTVTELRYCYIGTDFHLGTERLVFTLLILEQNGLTFTITDIISVRSIPSGQICTGQLISFNQYCCDNLLLDTMDQFFLPSSNFTFGVVRGTSFGDLRPLEYDNSSPQNTPFLVEHFRFSQENLGTPVIGNLITLSESDRQTDRALRLLQFFMTPIATVAPTTMTTSEAIPSVTTMETTTTDATPTSEPATTDEPTESSTTLEATTMTAFTVISSTSSEGPITNTDMTTTEELVTDGTNMLNITSKNPQISVGGGDESSSMIGVAVGAAVGGLLAIAMLLVVISCVVVVMVKRRSSWKLEQAAASNGGISFKNAIYGVEEQPGSFRHDYARIGPHNIGKAEEKPNEYELPLSHEYSYAYAGAKLKSDDAPGPVYEAVKVASAKEDSIGKFATWRSESIYMAPGRDESTLYTQLHEILVDNVSRNTVIRGDFLGSGQFGRVYRGVWQSSTRGEVEVAVKTLKEGSGEGDRVKFLQEATIMGQFKHPNVVEMYGVVTDGEPILLVLELLKKGDLRDHLLHMRPDEEGGYVSVDDHTLLRYCQQVASGMAYLSNKAFVHRDLAARNILVSDEEICKIADFGMSRDLMDESYYVSHGGQIPVKWTAPEALHYKKYSSASDVWSYGALMYEIWSVGCKPFENVRNIQVLRMIEAGLRLSPPPGCPRKIYAIMMECWHPVTSKRPGFVDISNQLSLPDTELLKWSEEDKSVHLKADILGADLLCAQDLYRDLQFLYKEDTT